jgi:hypothetical protein
MCEPPHGRVSSSPKRDCLNALPMAAEDARLLPLYRERKLLADDLTSVHLPTECPKHAICWKGAEARAPSDKAAELSAPWIGSHYGMGRLVVVLENLRDFGGWDLRDTDATKGMRYLGCRARENFAVGRKVLFKGKKNGGTRVWYQIASYAATWLATAGFLAKSWSKEEGVPKAALAEAFDWIAIVQHVKCSPLENRSNASDAMWGQCGAYVLKGELEVLAPKRLIVAGVRRNAGAIRARVLVGGWQAKPALAVEGTKMSLSLETRGSVAMAVVPHPASHGGTSRKLVAAFRDLVGPSTGPAS